MTKTQIFVHGGGNLHSEINKFSFVKCAGLGKKKFLNQLWAVYLGHDWRVCRYMYMYDVCYYQIHSAEDQWIQDRPRVDQVSVQQNTWK